MKHRKLMMLGIVAAAVCMLSATAYAIDESAVESAIAASSREEVAGNIFIWFLCAVAFLKVSQKIDSFMSGLGINVGRTGGSMLGELMIAGRAIGAAARATGGASGTAASGGSVFNRFNSNSSTTNQAAGQGYTAGGKGIIGAVQRAAGNSAVASATGNGSGLRDVIGGAMFASSMKNNGKFATDVVSTVATGSISSVGTISGPQASEALKNYLGYGQTNTNGDAAVSGGASGSAGSSTPVGAPDVVNIPGKADQTQRQGSGSGSVSSAAGAKGTQGGAHTIPGSRQSAPGSQPVSGTGASHTKPGGATPGFESTGSIPTEPKQSGDVITPNGGTAAGAEFARQGNRSSGPSTGNPIPSSPKGRSQNADVITPNGGSASGASSSGYGGGSPGADAGSSIPSKPPSFRDVEIGGGRITGYETPSGGGPERQFAMYNTAQYMEPSGNYEKVQSVDGQSWYKQYAEPTVQKTPFETENGEIKYEEKIVEQLPQIPKRKDRV